MLLPASQQQAGHLARCVSEESYNQRCTHTHTLFHRSYSSITGSSDDWRML